MAENPTYVSEGIDPELFPDLKSCLDIWNIARGERFAPSWNELGFAAFPDEVIARSILVDIRTEPLDFLYRFFGSVFCDIEGYDMTGKSVDDYQPPESAVITRNRLEAFYDKGEPEFYIMREGSTSPEERTDIYIGVRLPLSSDGETIDQFFGVAQIGDNRAHIKEYLDDLIRQSPNSTVIPKRSTSRF